MSKGGGASTPDLNKVFPGLITPSFSLLPQSQTRPPAFAGAPSGFPGQSGEPLGAGVTPDTFARLTNFASQNSFVGSQIASGRFDAEIPGTGTSAQGIIDQLSPSQLSQFLVNFGGRTDPDRSSGGGFGGGGGVFPGAGGGGGGDPFVLSRTGPDPFLDEQRLRGQLGQNTAGIQRLIGGLNPLRSQLAGSRTQIQVGRNRSAAGQRRLGGLTQEARRIRGITEEGLADVEPGFGRLTRTQVESLRNREAEQQGNLRESLRSRRVLGSSFGIREQQRLERDFGQEEERVRAESFLAEMDARRGVIDQLQGFLGLELGIEQGRQAFLELDQRGIEQRAQSIALGLGLNQQEAALLGQQFQNIQLDANLVAQRTTRELEELRIAGTLVNQAGATAAQLAGVEAQAAAANAGGFGEIIGSIAGIAAAVAICWVAREVYGPENFRWMLFRGWLLTKAPKWFRSLYIKHGERFAGWLKDKPRIKTMVRKFMDGRLAAFWGC